MPRATSRLAEFQIEHISMTALYSCLRGKAVFITGGATGIGATMVRTFVQQGCHVAFIDLNAEAGAALLAELQAELPAERASFAAVDVTDVQALQQAIEAAAQRFGLS